MSRLPVNEQHDTRQVLWDAMCGLGDETWFTVAEINRATDRNKRTIATYLDCLCAGGRAEKDEADGAYRYRLLGARDRIAPRLRRDGSEVTQGGGTANMWRSMRMLTEFSARELAACSTTPDVGVSESTAKSYCSILHRAGYLRATRPAQPGRPAIFRLIRNSGPKPPKIQRVKRVYDPNTRQTWDLEGGA